MSATRFMLICINAIAIIIGGSMAGFGVWMMNAGTSLFEMLNALDKTLGFGIKVEIIGQMASRKGILRTLALATIIAGSVALLIAIIGITAVLKKNSFLAVLYKIAVFCLLASHVIGCAVFILKRSSLEGEMKNTMLTGQIRYFVARNAYFNASSPLQQAVTRFYENLHISLNCCGVVKTTDIRNSSSYRGSLARDPDSVAMMPETCCKLKDKESALAGKQPLKLVEAGCPFSLNSTTLHKEPCLKPAKQLIDKVMLPGMVIFGLYALALAAALGLMAAETCADFDDDDDDDDSDSDSD